MTRKLKNSGVEWIGEIPESWELAKIGQHFKQRNEKVSDLDFKPLSVTKNGIVPQLDNAAKSSNHNDRKLVKKGDFVINSRSDRKQSSGIAYENGSVSLINLVIKSRTVDTNFTNYLLKNAGFAEEFYRWGNGIVADLWSTKWDSMKRIPIPLPELAEQKKIANVIRDKVKIIDTIISETQQSIDELKKYKQALITETVTKGLDKNVEMKDSGIEWIKKVPKSWEIKKTRFFLKEVSEKNYPNEEILSLYRDYGVIPKNSRDDNHNVTSLDTSGYKLVNHNQLVINKMKAWQGSMAISEIRGIISPAYYVYEVLDKQIYTKFLHYALRNNAYLDEYRRISAGLRIGQWDLNKDLFKNVKIAFPSTMDEQRQIVDFLEEKVKWIDNIVIEKEHLLIQFEQLKQSLIYEYVTGKKEA
ncbi:restriction endonuclease subunit S [Enterococcus faecium]|uniref:restriction endonuclease subunit S n=1 Tax=Enterococcus sp. HMSC061C05 TaxID=1739492 RepID=UPI0008D12E70|nr:restriction endonuclease subunit S [Enterococcus sp. HMSC061C05]EGP4766637.1 restriction endonuclease subunit S [Enterococcus faecium]EGP4864414.1 restriction endonuclease subunit S [Enterococcus faecium]EGP5145086.1 restriction endonuclease subunit S [Enterococcus faecium]EGP5247643.1 restriction endonuclease subunit S [Enterococcus faecium]EGP5393378.1 restriction endonuclease subunit S [Enterococcus faecium]